MGEYTFNTSTHVAPLLDVSTYDGPFSYDSLWGGEEEAEREEGRVVCDDYDHGKIGERIVHEANLIFDSDHPLDEYGVVSIKATKLGSPREYNFMTDWLELTVTVDDTFFDRAKKAILDQKNRETVVKHCKEHWVSHDGFRSSMLNRVSYLSLDHWRHDHYGSHLSTDAEIEAAVTADLTEAIEHLRDGTGDDDFREFGAVLGLLWRFEYPEDFAENGEWPWMTTEMHEHMRGNSSLGEFCTVLDNEEIKKRFGEHMCKFDEWRTDAKRDKDKFLAQEFKDPAHARAVAEKFYDSFAKYIDGKADDELDVIRDNVSKGDDAVNGLLDEFKDEWEASVQADMTKMWREAYDSVPRSVRGREAHHRCV